jgi:AcrR family transcriptional regulator
MQRRIPRAEQVERNREQVLAAARKVFLASGYAAATLDAIADEAGFSKGVVYSQFESKGDLLLALLERRIGERAEQNEAIAKRKKGREGLRALLRAARQDNEVESAWGLLLLEFRLQAARDPELNRRYAQLHRQTLARITAAFEQVLEGEPVPLPESPAQLAVLTLVFAPGILLERAADPRILPPAMVERAAQRLLGVSDDS